MIIDCGKRLVNLDHVRMVEAVQEDAGGRPASVRLTFTDGETQVLFESFKRLQALAGRIVPALPGYTLWEASSRDEGDKEPLTFFSTPIVAFRVEDGTYGPTPITTQGEPEFTACWTIIGPDGAAISAESRFPDLGTWKAWCEREL